MKDYVPAIRRWWSHQVNRLALKLARALDRRLRR
jgi:hypothetical protein